MSEGPALRWRTLRVRHSDEERAVWTARLAALNATRAAWERLTLSEWVRALLNAASMRDRRPARALDGGRRRVATK